jgi:hypothetical protein
MWVKLCQAYADGVKAPPTLAAGLVAPVKAWASANRAEEWAESVAPSREGGSTAIKLCGQYAETLK